MNRNPAKVFAQVTKYRQALERQVLIDVAALQKLQLKPWNAATDLETTKHTRLFEIASAAITRFNKMGLVAQAAASSRSAAHSVRSEFECVREGRRFTGKWLFKDLEDMQRPLLALERLRERVSIPKITENGRDLL